MCWGIWKGKGNAKYMWGKTASPGKQAWATNAEAVETSFPNQARARRTLRVDGRQDVTESPAMHIPRREWTRSEIRGAFDGNTP
jgi:hypothetical protein